MKHNLKRILPIFLAIVVILSVVWYLFSYDPEFTRDMLLEQARACDERGDHGTAAWLYNLAYQQSTDNDAVAIELAEKYVEYGNFTKAEYTLVNAISNRPSVELYVALSKTYIAQDKLLDAAAMLNGIADAQILSRLEAMRPAKPTASHDSGFYSQYITVDLSGEGGELYVSVGKEYPSVSDGPCRDGITLQGGQTVVTALVIGDNGLVSPLATFEYTISGVIEPVQIEDRELDALIRDMLGFSSSHQLYTNELWDITYLQVPATVNDYSDISKLTYLETLVIENGNFTDLSCLTGLKYLQDVLIYGCTVSEEDLAVIASLPALKNLTLSGCHLSSIAPLSAARQLISLDLCDNAIRDISALSFMSGLRYLNLSHNALENLSSLSTLSGLETLNVSYNSLTSVFPLGGCLSLKELNVSHNFITSLNGIENMAQLTLLEAGNNELKDASPIANCTQLTQLNISYNAITDITHLSVLTALKSFDFSHNKIAALPAFPRDCALVTLDGSYNSLTSVERLRGLENLNTVTVDYNKLKTVDPLADCPILSRVDCFGNSIKNVSKLKDAYILVNYDPS